MNLFYILPYLLSFRHLLDDYFGGFFVWLFCFLFCFVLFCFFFFGAIPQIPTIVVELREKGERRNQVICFALLRHTPPPNQAFRACTQ
jgi:hypothetical protein